MFQCCLVYSLFSQCTPSTSYSGQGITRVQFNTIDKSSTANNYVSDFTSTSTSVDVGSAYNMTITADGYGSYSNTYVRVWIDWNNDGSFNTTTGSSSNSGEQYTLGTASGSPTTTSNSPLSITVPSSAASGSVRMRVSAAYGSYTTACATSADAEFEDYTININAGPSLSYSSATFCSGDSDPSPTLSNNVGSGTYSSSAGLSINSSTGVIDISASTQGAYTVTYTDTDAQTATFDITINSNTIYVNDNSTSGDIYASAAFDGSGDGSVSDPYNTLTDAIAAATCPSTTTIYVDAGTYTEENISISDGTDDILIQGAGNSLTIFDGDNTDDWITFASGGNTDNITITDLTVKQYGGTASQDGGAMRILGGTNIVFEDVIFTENETDGATNWGAVAFIDFSADAKFDRCTFHNNTTSGRGSVFYDASNGTLEMYNCLVYENDAGSYGDIIIADASSSGGTHTITNCTFTDNLAQSTGMGASGEVFSIWEGSTTFNNCIFYNNASTYDVAENYETVTLNYCMFDAELNRSSVKNNTVSGTPTFSNASSDDYSLTSSSSGVDEGSATYAPALDILEVSRPQGLADDIGCFEYVSNTWTGAVSTAWTNTGNWSLGAAPTSSEAITIPNVTNQPVITSAVTLAGLTIDPSSEITISSNSLTINGSIDNNGTINIDNATLNADGAFDATGGTIDFTNVNGKLILSSTVTSLGTLDAAMGTVEYDGATQTVFGDNYYNLEIYVSGTKSAGGAINVVGNLTTSSTAGCKLDMGAYALNIAGDLTVGATDALDLSDVSSVLTFDGSSNQTISHAGNSGTQVGYELINHDFESSANGWTAGGSKGGMSFNRVSSPSPFSSQGNSTNVWTINPFNDYGSSDGAYVTSSAIDMTNMTSMSLSIDVRYNTESGYDGMNMYYSTNGGSSWTILGSSGSGTNWYNNTGVDGINDRYTEIASDPHGWSGDNSSWKTATQSIPGALEGESDVRFRVYFGSDGSAQDDGVAFDNVVITGTFSGTGSQATDLTINKSSGNVILSSEFGLDGTLTLTSGDIDASSNNLVLTSNATVSGADDDSHVIGTIVRTLASTSKADFPLGDGTELRQANVTPPDGTSRDWTVSYSSSAYGDLTLAGSLTNVSSTYYWDITPSSAANSSVIDLNWTSNPGIQDPNLTNIKLAHFTGTDWEEIATTTAGTTTTGSVSGTVSSFSPFTLGTVGANPLPIKLVTFYGEKEQNKNILRWTTASEKNNDYFTIEKTTDGKEFHEVGRIEGAGNSIYHNSYSLTDANVENILNYYRLVQTDFDGKKEYSDLITIDNRNSDNTERKLIKVTNTWGQEINEDYIGVAIYMYSDGTIERVFQN